MIICDIDNKCFVSSQQIKLLCMLCTTALNCSFAMRSNDAFTDNINVIKITSRNVDRIINGLGNTAYLDQRHVIKKRAFAGKRNLCIDITRGFPKKIERGAFDNCEISDCIITPDNFSQLKKELPDFIEDVKNKGICFREKSLIPSGFGTFKDGVLTLNGTELVGMVVFLLNTAIDNPENVMEIVCNGAFSGLYVDKGYKNVRKVTLPTLERQQVTPYIFDFCYYRAPVDVTDIQVLNLDSLDNLLEDEHVSKDTKTLILREKERRKTNEKIKQKK